MKKSSSSPLNFEEGYFEGYYKGIGDFTEKRDRELANWFRGIFEYINRYYPLKNGKGKKLIEFGCATGAASSVLRDFGWNVTATDISKYAVSKAQKNHKGIKFLFHDMEKPFKNRKFDLALAFDVIEHLPHPEVGIKNVYNLLKPNGVAIFTTPNDYPHVSNDPTHISVKKPDEWVKILKRAGFKSIFVKQVALVPYFYRWNWRLAFVFPFAVNFKYIISPVILIAKK